MNHIIKLIYNKTNYMILILKAYNKMNYMIKL